MEQSTRVKLIAALAGLPDMCAAFLLSDKSPILIHAGQRGYSPMPASLDVRGFNERHGITPAQVNAMMAGSMFGWDCPAADPAHESNADPRNDPYKV